MRRLFLTALAGAVMALAQPARALDLVFSVPGVITSSDFDGFEGSPIVVPVGAAFVLTGSVSLDDVLGDPVVIPPTGDYAFTLQDNGRWFFSTGAVPSFFDDFGPSAGVGPTLAFTDGKLTHIGFTTISDDGSFDIIDPSNDTIRAALNLNQPGLVPPLCDELQTQHFCFPHYVASLDFRAAAFGIPVPEPAAWLLLLVGFGAAGAALRRALVAQRSAAV